mmetsp:Transcript_26441/g.70132  ORF Transcript_26441/g.70132 Transcript_26441/m.70132 type:complete len:360 (+) Transcript_26441:65-1144(+)
MRNGTARPMTQRAMTPKAQPICQTTVCMRAGARAPGCPPRTARRPRDARSRLPPARPAGRLTTEEPRRLLHDRAAPQKLLHRKPGDRQHGQAAVLDLGRLQLLLRLAGELGLLAGHVALARREADRVEAEVAGHVAGRREGLDVVERLELDVCGAGEREQHELEGGEVEERAVEERGRAAVGRRHCLEPRPVGELGERPAGSREHREARVLDLRLAHPHDFLLLRRGRESEHGRVAIGRRQARLEHIRGRLGERRQAERVAAVVGRQRAVDPGGRDLEVLGHENLVQVERAERAERERRHPERVPLCLRRWAVIAGLGGGRGDWRRSSRLRSNRRRGRLRCSRRRGDRTRRHNDTRHRL